jgi:hypothetical protein
MDYTGSTGFYIATNSSAANIINYDNTPLNFGTNGVNTAVILPNGNMGIGTGGPISRLHVRDLNSKISIESVGGGAAVSSLDLMTSGAGTASLYKFNTGRLALASGGSYNMQFLNSIGGSFQFDEGSNTRMFIASGGKVGINTLSPATLLHVNGAVTITDGSQGSGKVLTSDASGNATWNSSTILNAPVSCQSISSVNSTPSKFSTNLATFTKTYGSTVIEVIFQSDLNVTALNAPANSVRYELRINGSAAAGNTGKANYFLNNGSSFNILNSQQVTIIGEFTGLAAGTYNIELWASTPAGGSASGVYYDGGCFGSSSVIVKEIK